VEIKDVRVQVPIASTYSSRVVVPHVLKTHNNKEEQQVNDPEVNNDLVVEQPQLYEKDLTKKESLLF